MTATATTRTGRGCVDERFPFNEEFYDYYRFGDEAIWRRHVILSRLPTGYKLNAFFHSLSEYVCIIVIKLELLFKDSFEESMVGIHESLDGFLTEPLAVSSRDS